MTDPDRVIFASAEIRNKIKDKIWSQFIFLIGKLSAVYDRNFQISAHWKTCHPYSDVQLWQYSIPILYQALRFNSHSNI